MEFSLTVLLEPPTARLVASGELDIFTAHQVAERLATAARSGCSRVLLDVSGVTFVDGSALGVLDRARAAIADADCTVGMVAVGASFRRVCGLAGLDAAFGLN